MKVATLLIAIALASAASAQTGTISGTVTDEGGAPLIGANVSLAGLAVRLLRPLRVLAAPRGAAGSLPASAPRWAARAPRG